MEAAMKTLVILVNRNNKTDTVECLESLRRCEGDFDVFVSDNGSTDGSLEAIAAWAEGRLPVDTSTPAWDSIRGHPLETPLVTWGVYATEDEAKADSRERWLTAASTGGSKGFPAGNNVGLRYGLTRAYDFFWILNNDTVVEPTALVRLVARMRADPEIGICGSTLLYYDPSDIVQAWGGCSFNRHLATSRQWGDGTPYTPPPPPDAFDGVVHIHGAAMFVSRRFVESVGLMNEALYLYFDEMDWTLRMGSLFKNGYEPLSVVYHKAGGTLGGYSRKPSRHRIYYVTVNRILFTRAHFPGSLPTVVAAILTQAAKNALRGRFEISGWILDDLLFGLTKARYPLTAIP
jgi:GT2 family glycosyltransferase